MCNWMDIYSVSVTRGPIPRPDNIAPTTTPEGGATINAFESEGLIQ